MGWRGDVRDHAVITCEAFQAANTSLVERVYRARPESIGETRSIYIGSIVEDIRHDAGTRQRIANVEVVCARHLNDNAESVDAVEDISDELVDWLSDRPHAFGDHTVQEPVRSESAEIDEGGGVRVPAVVITCRATIQQGRT